MIQFVTTDAMLRCRACGAYRVALHAETGLCLVCNAAPEATPAPIRDHSGPSVCSCGPVRGIGPMGVTCPAHYEERVMALIEENRDLAQRNANLSVPRTPTLPEPDRPSIGLPSCPICRRKFTSTKDKLRHYDEGCECEADEASPVLKGLAIGTLISGVAVAAGVFAPRVLAYLGGLL